MLLPGEQGSEKEIVSERKRQREREKIQTRVSGTPTNSNIGSPLSHPYIYIYVYSFQPFLIRREEILIGEESRHRDHDREVFFSEDRNLDLEEEEGKDRRRFSRSYNNKDALGIIEEQVVE